MIIINKYTKKIEKSKKKSHNSIKGGESVLAQEIQVVLERLKGFGFIREIEPEVYQVTELLGKYKEEGATFSLYDDEYTLKFISDNYLLFLKVISDEFFSKMNITNKMLEEYVFNYFRKNSGANLSDLSDKAIIHFSKESDLTEDELKELKDKPFFKDVFTIRISNFLETLTEFGLLTKFN